MVGYRKFLLGSVLFLSLAALPARADYVGGLNPAGDNFLALRTGPGSGYPMILPMGPGTSVRVLRRNGRWLFVELDDGTRGWAYGSYIFGGAAPGGFDLPPPPLDSAELPPPDLGPPDLGPPGMEPVDPGSQPPPLDPGDEAPPLDMGGEPPAGKAVEGTPPSEAHEPDAGPAKVSETGEDGAAGADLAVDPMASNWITYRNDRFGTRIDYSAPMFRMLPPPDNDDGRTFEARDGSARFIVFAGYNVFDSTLDELIEEHLAGLGDDEKVVQKRRGDNWYLHSGFRGDDFFLRKVMLSDDGGVIHTFEISYAKSLKAKLDPMAARMAQSLRTADQSNGSQGQAPDAGEPAGMVPAGTDDDGASAAGADDVGVAEPTGAAVDGWAAHAFEGFALRAPADWSASIEGDTLALKAPDGKRSLMVWWWFPDEPLLGYSDIVSNHKVEVDGRPALWIHSKTGDVETLSVTLDEGRADKKRLHFLFEATGGIRLGGGDSDFDRILQSVTIGGTGENAGTNGGEEPSPAPLPERATGLPDARPTGAEPEEDAATDDGTSDDADRRAWAGRASIAVPSGWQVAPDGDMAGGVVMTRPDKGAQIALSFWPKDKPMPSEEVASQEFTVVLGRPATVLDLSQGPMRGRQVFFDEPRGDGARLTIAYRAFGEDLADGLPLFEMVLGSLDETLAPPDGTEAPVAEPAGETDPFADIDLSDLEVAPR